MCCWYNTERRSILGAGLFVSVTVDLFVMRVYQNKCAQKSKLCFQVVLVFLRQLH